MSNGVHFKAAIIGAGPAGIGAAIGLAERGIFPVLLIDRRQQIGGIPVRYKAGKGSIATFIIWRRGRIITGKKYVESLQRKIDNTEVHIMLESQVIAINPDQKSLTIINSSKGKQQITADAVILACGSREKSMAERGWIAGSRSARVMFTSHLLDLSDQINILPCYNPAIIGSDVIAYATAAKLKFAGASESTIIDKSSKLKSGFFDRLYFGRWTRPYRRLSVKSAHVSGSGDAKIKILPDDETIPCDGLFLSGDLIPNSELALLAGLNVELPSRRLILGKDNQLSKPGWFAAGNILSGFHGAEYCYYNGRKVAGSVAKWLSG